MNKKFNLLLILPFLCACHGTSSSPDSILENIENIKNNYSYSSAIYDHFTLVRNKQIEDNKEYCFVAYDVEQKFYHTYALENNVLKYEEWKFVQKNSDGDVNIYYVSRDPADEKNEKPNWSKKLYSDDLWKTEEAFIRLELDTEHSEKLTDSKGMIESYKENSENKSLSLSSLNTNSFYLEYTEKNSDDLVVVDKTIEYKNKLFLSSKTKQGKNIETSITCSYDSFDVVYPKLKS